MDEEMISSSWNSEIEDNILNSCTNYIPTGFLEDSPKYYSYDSDETVLSQPSPELYANSEISTGKFPGEREVIEISDDDNSNSIFEDSSNSQSLLPDRNESQIFYPKFVPSTKSVTNQDNLIRDKQKICKEDTKLVGARSSQRTKRCPSKRTSNSLYQPVCFEVKADQSQRKKKDHSSPNEYERHRLQMEELNIAEAKLSSAKTLLSLRYRDQAETVLKKEVAERLQKIQQKINKSSSESTPSDCEIGDPVKCNQLLQVRQTRLQQLVESVETLKTEIHQSSVKTSQFMPNNISCRKSLYPVIEKTSTVKIVVKTSYKRTVTRTTNQGGKGRARRKSTARSRYPPLSFITGSQANKDAPTTRTNCIPDNKAYKPASSPTKFHFDSNQRGVVADQVVEDSCSDNGDDMFDDDSDCVPDPFLNNLNDETLNSNLQQVDASFHTGNKEPSCRIDPVFERMKPAKARSSPITVVEDSCPTPTTSTCSPIFSQSNASNVYSAYGRTINPSSNANFIANPRFQHKKFSSPPPVTLVEDSCPTRPSPSKKADTFSNIFSSSNVNSSCSNKGGLPDINHFIREGLIQKGSWMLSFKHKMTEYKASVTGNGKVISTQFDLFDNIELWLNSIVPFNFSRMKAYELVTYGEKTLIEICRNIDFAAPKSTENVQFSQGMEHVVDKELTFLNKLKSCRFRVLRAEDFFKASDSFIRDFEKPEIAALLLSDDGSSD